MKTLENSLVAGTHMGEESRGFGPLPFFQTDQNVLLLLANQSQ